MTKIDLGLLYGALKVYAGKDDITKKGGVL